MLTRLEVDGFRSLANFKMELRGGLNILIGPNGSGKSNVISFIEFLANLMRENLDDALSQAGGAGAFFQKTGEKSFKSTVTAVISGVVAANTRSSPKDRNISKLTWAQYEYSFSIKASEQFDSIVLAHQVIKILELPPRLDLRAPAPIETKNRNWEVIIRSEAGQRAPQIEKFDDKWVAYREVAPTIDDQTFFFMDMEPDALQSLSLLRVPSRIEALWSIGGDLVGGQSLNVNPNKVKEPEDSARPAGIKSDGSGLAATLWHMKSRSTYARYTTPYTVAARSRFFPQKSQEEWQKLYEQLQSIICLVNSQILNVTPENDPFNNQLKVIVTVDGPDGPVDLPLAALSDGTIKWIALITAILTSHSIFAIEEPENFLHPRMLREILTLMRDITSSKQSFVIMTTHSETLLNAAQPNEIVVVSMNHGTTSAKRLDEPDLLASEIRQTGFGLGYYYLTGHLSDV